MGQMKLAIKYDLRQHKKQTHKIGSKSNNRDNEIWKKRRREQKTSETDRERRPIIYLFFCLLPILNNAKSLNAFWLGTNNK